MIRVILADDHPALRIGLRVLLEQAPDISVVADTDDGAVALERIASLRPAVAVLDCQLPGMDGITVALEIQRQRLPTHVLALSAHSDERYVRGMLDAGAVGYLLKEEAPTTIVSAVRVAASGEGWFSPTIATRVAAWARGNSPKASRLALTEREREVLRLVVAGKANKEISATLQISEKTVEKYLSALFVKLGVSSRVEAAVKVVREGLG